MVRPYRKKAEGQRNEAEQAENIAQGILAYGTRGVCGLCAYVCNRHLRFRYYGAYSLAVDRLNLI